MLSALRALLLEGGDERRQRFDDRSPALQMGCPMKGQPFLAAGAAHVGVNLGVCVAVKRKERVRLSHRTRLRDGDRAGQENGKSAPHDVREYMRDPRGRGSIAAKAEAIALRGRGRAFALRRGVTSSSLEASR